MIFRRDRKGGGHRPLRPTVFSAELLFIYYATGPSISAFNCSNHSKLTK